MEDRAPVGLIDDALADESTGILPSSYPAPPDKRPISTMVLGPGVENGSELARLKERLDRAKPALEAALADEPPAVCRWRWSDEADVSTQVTDCEHEFICYPWTPKKEDGDGKDVPD